MSKEVIFRAVGDVLKDEEFVFKEKGLCLVGRSSDCALLIPKEKDMRISRRHCLLILHPPSIMIRDLGSRNGTYVNGEKLPPGTIGDVPELRRPEDKELHHGDRVQIGITEFEVQIPSEAKAAAEEQPPPPPGTKVIQLEKPKSNKGDSTVSKSVPVDTGFFISPGLAKGKPITTSTAPLTAAFVKPDSTQDNLQQNSETGAPGATLILKAKPETAPPVQQPKQAAPVNPMTQTSVPTQPAAPVPEKPKKTLKAKIVTPLPTPEIPRGVGPVNGHHLPPLTTMQPPKQTEATQDQVPQPEKPRKVLKGKIVRRPAAPSIQQVPEPPQAPPQEYNPDFAEVMDVSELDNNTKIGKEAKRKQRPQKRATKFKVKKTK